MDSHSSVVSSNGSSSISGMTGHNSGRKRGTVAGEEERKSHNGGTSPSHSYEPPSSIHGRRTSSSADKKKTIDMSMSLRRSESANVKGGGH